jgi:maleylacetoacetate isomerase
MKLFTFWRSLATYRVRVALAYKGLEVEPIYVDLLKGEQAKPEFKAVNPAMAVPVLVDDDGTVLRQSLAIMEYLDELYPAPPLMPGDAKGRARVRMLAQLTVADSHPLNVPRIRAYLAREFGASEQQIGAWARHWLVAGLDAYEAELKDNRATGDFCHGDAVTIADICLASHAAGVQFYGANLDGHQNVKRIVDRCLADERFAKAHPRRQPDAPATL